MKVFLWLLVVFLTFLYIGTGRIPHLIDLVKTEGWLVLLQEPVWVVKWIHYTFMSGVNYINHLIDGDGGHYKLVIPW